MISKSLYLFIKLDTSPVLRTLVYNGGPFSTLD